MAAMESTGVYWKPLYNLFDLMGLGGAYEGGARAENGHKGRGMDCGAAAARPAESQLHPRPGTAGASGADAVPQEPDRGMQPGAEPAAERGRT